MKQFTLFVLTLFLSFSSHLLSQQASFEWVKKYGSSGVDMGSHVGVDSLGNIYTTGEFEGTIDFDPGLDTHNLTSNGSMDVFFSKLDANGNFIWAKQFGSAIGRDAGYELSLDHSGNIYIIGTFDGTVDFDPDTSIYNLTSFGGVDIFISKLNSNGDFIWAKQMGGIGSDYGLSIDVSDSGFVYTTGFFSAIADFDPGTSSSNLNALSAIDIYISKIDTNGNYIWAKQLGGTDSEAAFSISVDNEGNIYTSGHFMGTVDFDPGSGISNLSSMGQWDIFISKLDPSGNYIWSKQIEGSSQNYSFSMEMDSKNNIYITGFTEGSADFDPGTGMHTITSAGGRDVYVAKYDSAGNFVWVKQFSGANDSEGSSCYIDKSGNIYTTGFFKGTFDFDPGPSNTTLTSNGDFDIFITKLDSMGNLIWAESIGALGDDKAYSICISDSGKIITTGYFRNTVDFNTGSGTVNETAIGLMDVFILKMDANDMNVGLGNLMNNNANIYPNPTTDNINIVLDKYIENAMLKIINIQGAIVLQKENWNSDQIQLDLSKHENGVYILEIQNGKINYRTKVIKQ